MPKYWQHENPIKCPKGTIMYWLGSVYWICGKKCCNQIYIQIKDDDS